MFFHSAPTWWLSSNCPNWPRCVSVSVALCSWAVTSGPIFQTCCLSTEKKTKCTPVRTLCKVRALIKLQIKYQLNVKTRLMFSELKKEKKSSPHSSLTFLIKLWKSIAGIFLSKWYNANIVLTRCCQGQRGLQQPTSSTLYWVCRLDYITDTCLLIVPQCHSVTFICFLWPLISSRNWIHTTENSMKYHFVLAQRQLNAQILHGTALK